MAKDFARPLGNDVAIERFLENCVGVRTSLRISSGDEVERSEIARRLREAEASVSQVVGQATIDKEECRHERYRTQISRRDLRRQIFKELCTLPRLDNDEGIRLGVGGALPSDGKPRAERNAYIVTGLPASGKSTLVNAIADRLGAVIVDSDYAKRKFPEFDCLSGAQIVHEESALVVEGGDVNESAEEEPSLLGFCKANGFNLVMPKIGHDEVSLSRLRKALSECGYRVHLTTVVLSRSEATQRALKRFIETRRYVPLGKIFDNYANDPALTYYKARVECLGVSSPWQSFGALSSQGMKYLLLDLSSDENPAAIYK